MIRLVRAELLKLRTTRMYLGLLAAASVLVVVVAALQFLLSGEANLTIEGAPGTITTEADLRAVLDVSSVAVLFTLILGATAVAGEDRHRTIATTFLLTPRRGQVLAAKVVAYVLAGTLFGLIVELAASAVVFGWLGATGAPIPFGSSVAAGLVLAPIASGLAAGFGVGIGAAIPNQLGAVLVAIGWVMVVEQAVSGLLPRLAPWLPFAGAGSAINGQNLELGRVGGIALFIGYLVVVLGLGAVVTRRRDIG